MSRPETGMPGHGLVACPVCVLPAEISDRFTVDGSPGPVEHLKLACVARDWCWVPTDSWTDGPGPAIGAVGAPTLIGAEEQREPHVGDMQRLPYKERWFDVVTAFNSLQFAADLEVHRGLGVVAVGIGYRTSEPRRSARG